MAPHSHVPNDHKHDFLTGCSVGGNAARHLACNGHSDCLGSVDRSNAEVLFDADTRTPARHPFNGASVCRLSLGACAVSALICRGTFMSNTSCSPSNARILFAKDTRSFSKVNGGYNSRPVTGSCSGRTFVVSLTAHRIAPVAGSFSPSIDILR